MVGGDEPLLNLGLVCAGVLQYMVSMKLPCFDARVRTSVEGKMAVESFAGSLPASFACG